jgi:hypothetical protein
MTGSDLALRACPKCHVMFNTSPTADTDTLA